MRISCFVVLALSLAPLASSAAQAPDAPPSETTGAPETTATPDAPSGGDPNPATDPPSTDRASTDPAGEPMLRAAADGPLPLPKVALVLVGDPDDAAVLALEALSRALTASGAVRQPADAALRRALAGRGDADGLDDVRSERRGLGLSERHDIPALLRLGRLATAAAVVVVRAGPEGYEAIVLDVTREAFFDGALPLPAAESDAGDFVGRRARAARDAAHDPSAAPAVGEAAASGVATEASSTPDVGAILDDAVAPEPPPRDPVLGWFEDNWAYLAAGALLAGGVAFVVVVATDPGPPQPMLRFVPGGP